MITLNQLYKLLLKAYGPQGWWPLLDDVTHHSRYDGIIPGSDNHIFEIITGAILTQNVAWTNVDTALRILKGKGLLEPRAMHEYSREELAPLIRSTGYYNQKAIKLMHMLDWMNSFAYDLEKLKGEDMASLRNDLLAIKGVGPETADSILLYALSMKTFVVDAYTRRILSRMGIIEGNETYEEIRSLFHKKFRGGVHEYKEYHALIVEHGKNICKKKPDCGKCILARQCLYSVSIQER
ncbi:MAG: endonuclease [Spirochaetae bacterium HGW-Spirochaetae-1]|nr:MAG: endonuclease [Spirochaetae bacterium HGW-Spirochaetae-1]